MVIRHVITSGQVWRVSINGRCDSESFKFALVVGSLSTTVAIHHSLHRYINIESFVEMGYILISASLGALFLIGSSTNKYNIFPLTNEPKNRQQRPKICILTQTTVTCLCAEMQSLGYSEISNLNLTTYAGHMSSSSLLGSLPVRAGMPTEGQSLPTEGVNLIEKYWDTQLTPHSFHIADIDFGSCMEGFSLSMVLLVLKSQGTDCEMFLCCYPSIGYINIIWYVQVARPHRLMRGSGFAGPLWGCWFTELEP